MASYRPGRYRVRIMEQGFGKAKSGNTQFILKIDVFGYYDPAQPPPDNLFACDPGERTIFRAVTEKAAPYLAEDLRALGYQGMTFSGVDPQEPNHHSFVGMDVDAICNLETYEGKTREKWSLAHGGSFQIDPVEKSEIRQLDAMFGRVLKSAPIPMSEARKAAVATGDGDPGEPAGASPPETQKAPPASPQAHPQAQIPAVVGSAGVKAQDDLPF